MVHDADGKQPHCLCGDTGSTPVWIVKGDVMKKLSLACLMVLFACDNRTPTFVSEHGTRFFVDEDVPASSHVTVEFVNMQEEWMIEHLPWNKDDIENHMKDVNVQITKDYIKCALPRYDGTGGFDDGKCAGTCDGNDLVVKMNENNVYVHEMAHSLQKALHSSYDPDYLHEETIVWNAVFSYMDYDQFFE